MRIDNLKVRNFRGIQTADIDFSEYQRLVCIIGPGDSTKSTVLQAIEYALYPNYGLLLNDSDFYNNDISTPIVIEVTVSEICDALISEEKYGLYLRGDISQDDDEPQSVPRLTVRLTVDQTLDPKWEVVCNRKEPKTISYRDRRRLCICTVGDSCSSDLAWGRGSVLNFYADAGTAARQIQTSAQRAAVGGATQSEDLNAGCAAIVKVAKLFGVITSGDITNQLMFGTAYSASSIGVFDGNVPLKLKGRGSQRLLSIGLNAIAEDSTSVLLLDEIESGLEPYRVRSLINTLRHQKAKCGQIIFSTHSSVVVAECSASELMFIQSENGLTHVKQPVFHDDAVDNRIQAIIREKPEAMLSRRIIVCEGKTECGFMYAIDEFLKKRNLPCLAACGVSWIDGDGSNQYGLVEKLCLLGFQVALFCDSDRPEDKRKLERLESRNVKCFQWNEGFCIETQIFRDSNIDVANALIQAMRDNERYNSCGEYLDVCHGIYSVLYPDKAYESCLPLAITEKMQDARDAIGSLAKKHGWIKNITAGRGFGAVVMNNIFQFDQQSGTRKLLRLIVRWSTNHD